ncbi:hypothetical protein D3C80_1041590 [compost metagenome]
MRYGADCAVLRSIFPTMESRLSSWYDPDYRGGSALVPAVTVVTTYRLAVERSAESAGTLGAGRYLAADAEIHPLPPNAACLAGDSGFVGAAPGRFWGSPTERY